MHERIRWVTLLLLCSLAVGSVQASSDKKANREREALRRAQMQLQQTQGQLATLEADNAKLGAERDLALKESKAAQSKVRKLNKSLAEEKQQAAQLLKDMEAHKQDFAASQTRLTDTEAKLAETAKTLAQTRQTLAQTEADKRQLDGVKSRQEREIASCETKNLKLYQTGRDLMTRFEQKSCGEILAQKEPFTGLKRVEVENLLEEYRDKLDEQKLIKAPGS
jgi:hypothetical protein